MHHPDSYSIVIPARNEADSLQETIQGIHRECGKAGIPYEIVLVNDHSTDKTSQALVDLAKQGISVQECPNTSPPGFGNAVRCGLRKARGSVVAIVMADGSEDPGDVVAFYEKIVREGFDCCFGDRWSVGGSVGGYPLHKFLINRIVNLGIMLLFGIGYKDVTNAFKV